MEFMESRGFETTKHVIENASNASRVLAKYAATLPFAARFLSYRRLGMYNLHNVMNI
jgi:hypothetical protein